MNELHLLTFMNAPVQGKVGVLSPDDSSTRNANDMLKQKHTNR